LLNDYESLSGNKLIYISCQVQALDFFIDWAVEIKLKMMNCSWKVFKLCSSKVDFKSVQLTKLKIKFNFNTIHCGVVWSLFL